MTIISEIFTNQIRCRHLYCNVQMLWIIFRLLNMRKSWGFFFVSCLSYPMREYVAHKETSPLIVNDCKFGHLLIWAGKDNYSVTTVVTDFAVSSKGLLQFSCLAQQARVTEVLFYLRFVHLFYFRSVHDREGYHS